MLRPHILLPIFLTLATLILASCAGRQTAATLNDVETYIQARPDSALATIRAIDTTTLTTRSLRAHYALLHAMALDKNWIDTTDVNVVMPAVDYYAKHGTADQKMKAYYYLGRIYVNGHNQNSAIISYTQAEDASIDSYDDCFKGLLSMAMADIYKSAHFADKEREYIEKGMEFFHAANDSAHYNLSYGRLAMSYQEKKEWAIADSLFRKGIELSTRDTAAMRMFLVHYATMMVLQPDPKPHEAIDLLNRARLEYKLNFPLKVYGIYAYASVLVGDDKTCDAIQAFLDNQPDIRRKETRYYDFLISKYRGEYSRTIDLLTDIYSEQDKNVDRMLNNSITTILQDYYQNQAIKTKHQSQIQQLVWAVVLLSVIITGGIVLFIIKRKHGREKEEAERLIQLSEESNQLLKNMAADLENKVAMLESTSDALTSEMQSKIESLQQLYGQLFKGQFSTIADLCRTYLRTRRNGENFSKDQIYRKVKDMLEYISDDKNLHAQFEAQIDKRLDNIVSHLKADLGEMSQLDERFLCYTIVGFDSRTIATLLGLSLANVYTKKSRLKDRIYELDSPYKEFYVRVI
ncbi:MAG: hypothetical protein IJU08_03520 [Bacteroidales bacterium]|nr:hypothetical protein [Bacteroidales bacterium]MBQ9397546.1 hypothetical protein [Bacteroidales bacterium]